MGSIIFLQSAQSSFELTEISSLQYYKNGLMETERKPIEKVKKGEEGLASFLALATGEDGVGGSES